MMKPQRVRRQEIRGLPAARRHRGVHNRSASTPTVMQESPIERIEDHPTIRGRSHNFTNERLDRLALLIVGQFIRQFGASELMPAMIIRVLRPTLRKDPGQTDLVRDQELTALQRGTEPLT